MFQRCSSPGRAIGVHDISCLDVDWLFYRNSSVACTKCAMLTHCETGGCWSLGIRIVGWLGEGYVRRDGHASVGGMILRLWGHACATCDDVSPSTSYAPLDVFIRYGYDDIGSFLRGLCGFVDVVPQKCRTADYNSDWPRHSYLSTAHCFDFVESFECLWIPRVVYSPRGVVRVVFL